MKKMSAWILALVLALTPAAAGCENGAPPAAGEETPAAKVMPLPVDPEELDFSDGRFEVRIDGADLYEQEESLPLMLYVTDLYDAEQIENLAPGDTVLAAGKYAPSNGFSFTEPMAWTAAGIRRKNMKSVRKTWVFHTWFS